MAFGQGMGGGADSSGIGGLGAGAFGGGDSIGSGNPLDSIEDRELQDAIARAVLGIDQFGNPQDMGQTVGNLQGALNMSINPGYGVGIPGQVMNIGSAHPQGPLGAANQVIAGLTPGLTQGYNFSEALGNIIGGNIANFQDDPSKKSMRQAMATDVMSGLLGNPNAIDMNEAMDFATVANFVNQDDENTSLNYDENGNLIGFTEPPIESFGAGTTVTFDDDTPYGYQGPIYGPDYDNNTLGVNPLSAIIDVIDNIELEEYMDNPNPALPGVQNFINETFFSQDSNVQPSIELIDPIDITPSANLGVNTMLDAFGIENRSPTSQQEVDALMDNVLGMQSNDGMNLDYAVASTGTNPFSVFGPEFRGISPEVNFDTKAISEAGGEALQEALAQRAVENILSQQAPRQMINVTPPAPPKVAPQRRAAPKPSPIQVAAKAITRPEAVKELPKFAQESLRQGKVPTGLNSRNQDLVDRVLATPKVDIMSAGVNVKGNRALQKARSRAAQDAKN